MKLSGGVATDRRLANQTSIEPPSAATNAIINENEFPSLGAKGLAAIAGAAYSPIPTTSTLLGSTASQSVSPLKESLAAQRTTNYANLMRADPSLTSAEFQIQSEDFPALPGVTLGQSTGNLSNMIEENSDGFATNENAESFNSLRNNSSCDTSKGIITHPDGEVSNIPPSMLADPFGMAGLVTYLRTVDNPSIVSLALGYDLTTLGLNLNLSERQLYTTFGGPWADAPIKAHELDVKVPEEYLTNVHIRDKLPAIKMNKLNEDVLFYLFYNFPNQCYQLAAAQELYQRDWRFHKVDGVWLTRSNYGGIKEQTNTYERGHYNVFDQMQWRKIPKELKLEYKELEEKPKVPTTMAAAAAAAAAATPVVTSAPSVSNLLNSLNPVYSINPGSVRNGRNGAATPPPAQEARQHLLSSSARATPN